VFCVHFLHAAEYKQICYMLETCAGTSGNARNRAETPAEWLRKRLHNSTATSRNTHGNALWAFGKLHASIIPGSRQQYDEMRQALECKKRYVSDAAKMHSSNLTEPTTALK